MSARNYDLNVFKKQRNITVNPSITYSTDREVLLHGHLIFCLRGSEITLSSCQWRTATTKTAINRALTQLNLRTRITQTKGVWYLVNIESDTKTLFYDGIKLDTFGNIIHVPDVRKPILELCSPWQK